MNQKFFRKYIFVFLIGLILSMPVFADKASYVTKNQADNAVALLKTKAEVSHYCEPCKDTAAHVEQIGTVAAAKADYQHYWSVMVNGFPIDLAYIYFPLDNGEWKNLAFQIGLRYDNVPEFLSAKIPLKKFGETANPYVQPNPAPAPKPEIAPTSAIDWMPVVEMNNQIFPAFFLATATQPTVESQQPGVIGDAQGKIGIHIVNPQANTRLKLVYEVDSIVKTQEFETTLAVKGKHYQIYPKIIWNWEALKRFKKASPANASFSLYLDGKLVEKKSLVVRIRSINEAVYAYSYLLDENRWASTGWLFAAYVNEDHEWIDQILKEALDRRMVNSFSGYQGKPEDVIRQVFAVWHVLQRRGFRYSSITNTSGTGTTDKVFSQYVRFFEESVNSSQANCVDGTVLLASILKKIDIRVGLVLVPGHCFLVFDLDGKGNWRGLETTMMGNVDLARLPDENGRLNASTDNFLDAVATGSKNFADSAAKINENHPQYKFIDVDAARRAGIFPISW